MCSLAKGVFGAKCSDLLFYASLLKVMQRWAGGQLATSEQPGGIGCSATCYAPRPALPTTCRRCLKQLLAGDYSAAAGGPEQARELQGAVECICAGASRDRLLQVVVTSLGGDPKEVLEGFGHHPQAQHAATASAGPEPGKKVEAKRGRRAKQGGKKAEAAAKPAGKKKASQKGGRAVLGRGSVHRGDL